MKKNPYAKLDLFVEEGLKAKFTASSRLQIGPIMLYTRVASRYVNGAMVRTLDIGTVETSIPQKGHFTRLLNHMERLAHKHGIPVYVESILNEHLQAFLERRGYEFTGEPLSPNAMLHVEALNAKFEAIDSSPSP
jgi:hypothetical protein